MGSSSPTAAAQSRRPKRMLARTCSRRTKRARAAWANSCLYPRCAGLEERPPARHISVGLRQLPCFFRNFYWLSRGGWFNRRRSCRWSVILCVCRKKRLWIVTFYAASTFIVRPRIVHMQLVKPRASVRVFLINAPSRRQKLQGSKNRLAATRWLFHFLLKQSFNRPQNSQGLAHFAETSEQKCACPLLGGQSSRTFAKAANAVVEALNVRHACPGRQAAR